jgi:putative NADH-flavin reductase
MKVVALSTTGQAGRAILSELISGGHELATVALVDESEPADKRTRFTIGF